MINPRPGHRRHPRALSLIAGAFAVLYIISKIQFALVGRLGIHGGPVVTEADAAAFGTTEQIARAQWGNVGAGVLILIATLTLPRIRGSRWWIRCVAAIPLALFALSLVSFGVGMIINGSASDRGGHSFGTFAIVWGVVLGWLASATFRAGRVRTPGPRIAQVA